MDSCLFSLFIIFCIAIAIYCFCTGEPAGIIMGIIIILFAFIPYMILGFCVTIKFSREGDKYMCKELESYVNQKEKEEREKEKCKDKNTEIQCESKSIEEAKEND